MQKEIMYKQCANCVLDTVDDPEIVFNESGICNYCLDFIKQNGATNSADSESRLIENLDRIRLSGKGQKYDSIIGLSGGVDSSYLSLKAKQWGLRPLIVHFDNGWNSELAVNNIDKIISRLGFDLYTLVVQWEEFRDLQRAFLKASVVDIEMITDHAIIATLYKLAIRENIKYILSGTNIATEAILPLHWIHHKADYIQIRAIQKEFVGKPFKTYPLFSVKLRVEAEIRGIQSISLLNYIPYNKSEAKAELIRELNWCDYGGKHYESVFTRFYQGYILPTKFLIDKRKAHFSSLICSKQMTRDEAIEELKKPIYDPELFRRDYEFVIKKLGFSEEEFEIIMNEPPRKHSYYPIESNIYERYPALKSIRPFWKALKRQLTRR